MTPTQPYLLSFTRVPDTAGTLVSTQDAQGLPFAVQRVFWVWAGPDGATRGGHAHKTTQEILVVLNGQVQVETETKEGKEVFSLVTPTQGLYIPPFCWITLKPSAGALLCCMTSTVFEEEDYIREYNVFQRWLS